MGLALINGYFFLANEGQYHDNQTTVPAKASVKEIFVI